MNAVRTVRALGPIDARNVWRDSFLRWLLSLALVIGAAVRFGVPPLTDWLLRAHGFDLAPHYPVIASSLLLMLPILVGMIVGFMLLDERDDRSIVALQVTPLSLRGYLAYRLTVPVVVSTALTVAVVGFIDLAPVGPVQLIALAIAVSPLAPIYALFLASFAANKVQGLALSKANGFLTIPPLVAWFVEGPWQLAFGVVPTYWPARAYWQMAADPAGGGADGAASLAIGVVFELAVLWLLTKRFERLAHR